MSAGRAAIIADLRAFLKTIQKPGKPVDTMGEGDGLVSSGLIDSLAVVQIVTHLEAKYGIDFAVRGLDPEQLASMGSIADLILERRT